MIGGGGHRAAAVDDQSTAPESTTADDEQSTELVIEWTTTSSAPVCVTRLVSGRSTLGRGRDATTQLVGTEVSRIHAEILVEGALVVVRDCGSRNGVHVNGRAISSAPVGHGDVVRIGEWTGVLARLSSGTTLAESSGDVLWGADISSALARVVTVAPSRLNILVFGETGTGKECVAAAVHGWSKRTGRLVSVNCSRLTEELAESTIFGHRRGSFTGAIGDRAGLFEEAHLGTLFLDEVAELPLTTQAKLLRVIEDGRVTRMGGSHAVDVDARIVAATHQDLRDAVDQKRFREDLFSRLNGMAVTVPALRARRREIPGLFLHLIRRRSGGRPPRIDPRALEALCLHDWPQNVRELVQVADRLLALHAHAGEIKRGDVQAQLAASGAGLLQSASARCEASPSAVRDALQRQRGNVNRAAADLGMTRQALYRLMARFGLEVGAFRTGGGN